MLFFPKDEKAKWLTKEEADGAGAILAMVQEVEDENDPSTAEMFLEEYIEDSDNTVYVTAT